MAGAKATRQTRKKMKGKCPYPAARQCHPRGCMPLTDYGVKSEGELKSLATSLGVAITDKRSLLEAVPLESSKKAQLAKKWLRPAQPEAWKKDPDMWLDSNNIRDVMMQYEESMPTFKFLGPYPIDFAAADPYSGGEKKCLINEMCELDLDGKDLEGKDHIGIVYNLDPHYKDGSHWVANYINIPKKTCYYFDSYGLPPPKEIDRFMQWLTIQEPTMKLGWNGVRFQKKNSECGMYCLYFLSRMLAHEPFLKFCRCAPSDAFMLELRNWIFST